MNASGPGNPDSEAQRLLLTVYRDDLARLLTADLEGNLSREASLQRDSSPLWLSDAIAVLDDAANLYAEIDDALATLDSEALSDTNSIVGTLSRVHGAIQTVTRAASELDS